MNLPGSGVPEGWRVLVWNANPTIDVVSVVPTVRLGAVHLATEQTFSAGGKGTLVMRGLSTLGIEYLGLTPIAGPSGDLVAKLMRQEQLASEFSQVSGSTRAAVTVVDGNGVDTNVNGPGPDVHDELWRLHVTRVATLLSTARYDAVIIADRPPLTADLDDLARVCRAAAEQGTRVALDVEQPYLEVGLTTKPWLVKINRAEAAAVAAPRKSAQDVSLRQLVDALLRLGAENVVLTDGPGVVEAALRGERLAGKPPAVSVRSAIGCGDAFLAGLIYGLSEGERSVDDALRCAIAVAAASAEDLRPGFFSPERAADLFVHVEVWHTFR